MQLIVILLCLILPLVSFAADVTALGCTKTAVSNAITATGGSGTITLPVCTETWASPAIDVTGDISFVGAGKDQTKLYMADNFSLYFFQWNRLSGSSTNVRVSGIGFYALNAGSRTSTAKALNFNNVAFYRIDNCHIEGLYHDALTFTNTPSGLVDHCTFLRTWEGGVGGASSLNATGYNHVALMGSGATPGLPASVINGYQIGEYVRIFTTPASLTGTQLSAGSAVFDSTAGSGTGTLARVWFYINTVSASPTITLTIYQSDGTTVRSQQTGITVTTGMNYIAQGSGLNVLSVSYGDRIGITVSNCTLGDTSIWGELWDTGGTMAQFESDWVSYWTGSTARSARNGVKGIDTAWLPSDTDAHFFEYNTVTDWFKGIVGPYPGGGIKLVVRHNTFNTQYIKIYMTTFNLGNSNALIYDNTFTHTGPDSQGPAIKFSVNGLIYGNTFSGFSKNSIDSARYDTGFLLYFPVEVRPREAYIWNNTDDNGSYTWGHTTGGNQIDTWSAPNLSHFFRAPQSGDRIYGYSTPADPHPASSKRTLFRR